MSTESLERDAAVRAVNHWLHRHGEYPGDKAIEQAMQHFMADWVAQRSDGMDVLASAALDDAIELTIAMRDLL